MRMLTIEKLRAWGADVDEGLGRCMNNEGFYLRLAEKALQDPNFGKLKEAVDAQDREGAFDAAHALKGVTLNLALRPVSEPVVEATERLRGGDIEVLELVKEIEEKRKEILG